LKHTGIPGHFVRMEDSDDERLRQVWDEFDAALRLAGVELPGLNCLPPQSRLSVLASCDDCLLEDMGAGRATITIISEKLKVLARKNGWQPDRLKYGIRCRQ